MKKKLLLLALVVVLAVAVFSVPSQAEIGELDYVDSWEITSHMSDEELIAIVEEVLQCQQGTIPDHAFAAIVRMQDIDPELSKAACDHIAEISRPAELPEFKESAPSAKNNEPERFSVYVRDGHGGHYEYYTLDDLEPNQETETEDESVLGEGDQISPQDASDCHTIPQK